MLSSPSSKKIPSKGLSASVTFLFLSVSPRRGPHAEGPDLSRFKYALLLLGVSVCVRMFGRESMSDL